MRKPYRLTAPDGSTYESTTPGELGGNRKGKIYGRLDCWSANLALPKGYAKHRVFFKDEAAAIAAGYRPCGHCHKVWKAGGEPGTLANPGESFRRNLGRSGLRGCPTVLPARREYPCTPFL